MLLTSQRVLLFSVPRREVVPLSPLPPKLRVAFSLHGGVGYIDSIGHALQHMQGSIGVRNATSGYLNYRACAKSMFLHIVQPNAEDFAFDFFQHSWNTDLEADMRSAFWVKTPAKPIQGVNPRS